MSKSANYAPNLSILSEAKELKNRILFTLGMLIIYRIGAYIPLPGVNPVVLSEIAAQNAEGVLGMFNMLSGGSLGRMSIFALAIVPYITSSIILQLLTIASKTLESVKKEGEAGRRKINQYTRYLTVILSMFQGYGLAVSLEHMNFQGVELVNQTGGFFEITTVVTLTCGTMFLMWLGEQITARGIGNGTSLIIFTGIIAGMPTAIAKLLDLSKAGAISPLTVLVLIILSLSIVAFIVFMERAQRKILVQYPKRQQGNKIFGGETSHLPLKLNTAGVIPPIFASSILLFPATIANFAKDSDSRILENLVLYLGHGKILYIILYVALIIFFSFFYTAVVFNPDETAENLKKYGGFIPGRRPGKNTAEFLDYVLTRLTVLGAIYMSVVCVLPEVIISKYSIPFYLGGTSILIVVNVVIDTMTQIQSHLFAHQYDHLIKKVKIREKRS